MNHDTQTNQGATFAPLVGGILSDIQALCRQEVELAKREIHQKIRHAKILGAVIITGFLLLVLATVALVAGMIAIQCR